MAFHEQLCVGCRGTPDHVTGRQLRDTRIVSNVEIRLPDGPAVLAQIDLSEPAGALRALDWAMDEGRPAAQRRDVHRAGRFFNTDFTPSQLDLLIAHLRWGWELQAGVPVSVCVGTGISGGGGWLFLPDRDLTLCGPMTVSLCLGSDTLTAVLEPTWDLVSSEAGYAHPSYHGPFQLDRLILSPGTGVATGSASLRFDTAAA